MKKSLSLLTFLFIMLATSTASTHKSSSDLLLRLDSLLSKRQSFLDKRELRIQDLKNKLQSAIPNNKKYSISKQLYQEYHKYMCDSAISYLHQGLYYAEQLRDETYANHTKLELIFLYASSGVFEECPAIISSLQPSTFNSELKLEYYITLESYYGELARLANENRNKQRYDAKRRLYEDSILQIAPPKHERALKIKESYFLSNKMYKKALEINNYRLSITPDDDPRFSIVAFDRFLIEREMKDLEEEKIFLIQSAICDVRNAIRDNASLSSLANLLHSQGEIDRAYRYIKVVQEDAAFYHARLRFIQVSSVMPIIEESFRIKSEKQKQKILISLISISGLAFFLFLTLYFLNKQRKKLSIARDNLQALNEKLLQLNDNLRALNHELSTVNNIKEVYIGQFLNICSVYIDKMDSMRKTVLKKISTGKVPELQSNFGSQDIIDKEVEEFYKNFDEVFLHIFPRFVEEFNSYLIESERIDIKKGELLTVELRIFALIRLGINDSAKIAKLLRYSVNTIYNYRAKVKNKVKVSRDEFESVIMNIGTFNV